MRFASLAIALAVLSTPAWAQIGNPAGMDPATPEAPGGAPSPQYANTQDKLFAQLLGSGGLAEVELGKLAGGKARAESVKLFAGRMVEDHTKANDELAALAKQAGIPLPGELNPDDRAMREDLDRADARAFDLTYVSGQIVSHQKAAVLLQYEIGQGQNAQIQRFAAKTLPLVLAHLEMARVILTQLRSATSP
jgi:putative membrane protein